MQLSATPHRHHAVQSVQAVPMLALPCGENPLEKLSGPQVRGERESVQWGQDRVVKISPSGGHFQKKNFAVVIFLNSTFELKWQI